MESGVGRDDMRTHLIITVFATICAVAFVSVVLHNSWGFWIGVGAAMYILVRDLDEIPH